MVYTDETSAQEIGKLNYSKFLFAYHEKNLIFLDNDLFLSTFNIENKQINRLVLSSVSPEYGDYNSGFIADGNNTLYFLKGGCAEIYSCDLYSFELNNNKEILLKKDIKFLKHGGIGISSFDKEKNELILVSSMGDGGVARMEVYKFSISKKELSLVQTYEYTNFCENDETCREAEQKKNNLYNDGYNKYIKRPESISCSGIELKTENKGRFVSCIYPPNSREGQN